jgi:D-cysteine desulfhydrase
MEIIAAQPRLGWVEQPSPVEALPEMAASLGLESLWIKRDDTLGAHVGLPGGTKIRKLDVLLAAPPWRDAPGWASVGAIGSGQLVALSAAARLLGRTLRAHLFWEPPLPGLLENLAYVASGPGDLRYTDTRVGLALRHPRALLSKRLGTLAVVPPGASALLGQVGVVRGALELAAQIEAGACPRPAHLFVPLGSGGTLVGLLAGLGLAGLTDVTVHGVATVERLYSLEITLGGHVREVLRFLDAPETTLPTLRLHRDQLGPAYGVATPASLAACERFAAAGIGLEPIYSGKAMAGLMAAAQGLRGPVMFWLTPRAPTPLPAAEDWRARLPRRLQRRLAASTQVRSPARRRVMLGVAGLAALTTAWRFTGYPEPPAGLEHLPRWAAGALAAAVEVVVTPTLDAAGVSDILRRVDAFLRTQPFEIRVQVLGAISLVEQGAGLLTTRVSRFSRLPPPARLEILDALVAQGGLAAEAGRAVRDLCMLGHYQRPESWAALGYGGPWVPEAPRPDPYGVWRSSAPPPGFEAES